MEINLNSRFLGEVLMGPEIKAAVGAQAAEAERIFQGEVAKRTGALAGSAEAYTEVGGFSKKDRWVGVMRAGGEAAPYAASNQFGAGNHPGSTGRHHNTAAETMKTVLEQMEKP